MPAYAAAAIALVMPGTTSNGTPAAASASASSPPRPNTNGSPPLSRTTRRAGAAPVDEQRVDLVLGQLDLARAPCRRDAARRRGARASSSAGDASRSYTTTSAAAQQLGAPHGQQARIARARADEVDGHAASPSTSCPRRSSSSDRPPRSSSAVATAVARAPIGLAPSGGRRAARRGRRATPAAPPPTISAPSTVASAPHGRLQPPPSCARNARSAPTAAWAARVVDRGERARGSRRRRRGTRPRARPARPAAASPTVRGTRRSRSASPSRSSAAAATTIGVDTRAACSRRVAMLPRSSANVRSGRSAASCARRRTEPVADPRAGRAASSSVEPTSASRGSARSGTAASTRPSGCGRRGQVLGRVHREVGAPCEHRVLHLLHEDAGAAEGVDRARRCGGHRWSSTMTSSASTPSRRDDPVGLPPGQRAAACRDAQRARHQLAGSVGVGVGLGETEQLDERVGVQLAARGAGGVLQADGRLVEQLVDDAAGERLDRVTRAAGRGRRAWRGGGRARPARTSSAWARSDGDERRHLARGALDPVAVELVGDDLAHLADLLAALRERLLAERPQVVDVEQGHAEHLARAGVDVAGHGDVDDEQRRARRARSITRFDVAALDEDVRWRRWTRAARRTRRARRGSRRAGSARPPTRAASSAARDAVRLATTISRDAGAGERERHAFAHARRRRARGRGGRRASRGGSVASATAADETDTAWRPMAVSVRARLPTSIAWRNVRDRSGPLAPSRSATLPRLADLAEDLALADDHRVEPGGDAEEVRDRGVVVVRVQEVGELVGVDARTLGEEVAHVLDRRVEQRGVRRRPRCGCTSTAARPRRGARAAPSDVQRLGERRRARPSSARAARPGTVRWFSPTTTRDTPAAAPWPRPRGRRGSGRACRNRGPARQSASSRGTPRGPHLFPGLREQRRAASRTRGPSSVAEVPAQPGRPGPGCARRCRSVTTRSPWRTTDISVNEQLAGSSAEFTQTRRASPASNTARSTAGHAGGGDGEPGAVEVGGRRTAARPRSGGRASAQARTSSPTLGRDHVDVGPGAEERLDLAGGDPAGADDHAAAAGDHEVHRVARQSRPARRSLGSRARRRRRACGVGRRAVGAGARRCW